MRGNRGLRNASGWMTVGVMIVLGLSFLSLAQPPSGTQTSSGPGSGPKMMVPDAVPSFEVATIKPSDPKLTRTGFQIEGRHVVMTNQTLENLIALAYGLQVKQVVGGPAWFETDRYDIDGVPDVEGQPDLKQVQTMYQKLLADRFKLVVHRDTRELSVYELVAAKAGPKLASSKGDPNGMPDQRGGARAMTFTNTSMGDFALMLEFMMDRPILDKTGLAGRFDFVLSWTPLDAAETTDPTAPPGIFTAVQEQLGLKLEPVKAPAEVLVVDKAERPSAN
jgi:uncharacterized protein (TIGR03435 family)